MYILLLSTGVNESLCNRKINIFTKIRLVVIIGFVCVGMLSFKGIINIFHNMCFNPSQKVSVKNTVERLSLCPN